jgi:hypothetical protein
MKKPERIILQITDRKLKDKVKKIAKKDGQSLSFATEIALKEYIEKRC